MSEPVWLNREICLEVQERLLERFGGLAGIRDEGLLVSALMRPQHLFHYGTPDLYELAAGYAEGIVKNHPFLDGNKRSGFMMAALFLEANNQRMAAAEEEAVVMTVALADGRVRAEGYALWLREHCEGRSPPAPGATLVE